LLFHKKYSLYYVGKIVHNGVGGLFHCSPLYAIIF